MNIIKEYLSALIDLFFPRFDPNEPEKEIEPRNWLEIIGILLLLRGMITFMVILQG